MFSLAYTPIIFSSPILGISLYVHLVLYWFDYPLLQAEMILPEADVEIAIVTPQLAQSAVVITEQLVLATETENIVSLLPIDLNTTNNVVDQVKKVKHGIIII